MMYTAYIRVARIRCAGIPVVAREGAGPRTTSARTCVTRGAEVPVVAWRGVRGVDTSAQGATRIGCAHVAVVTGEVAATGAQTDAADIIGSAGVPVVADQSIGAVITPTRGITCVVGAWVSVVTIQDGASGRAGRVSTRVANGARAAIVAAGRIRCMDAATRKGTAIVCAWVCIIAFQSPSGCAITVHAMVAGSARVPVITTLGISQMLAALISVADISGTDFAIIAIQGAGS